MIKSSKSVKGGKAKFPKKKPSPRERDEGRKIKELARKSGLGQSAPSKLEPFPKEKPKKPLPKAKEHRKGWARHRTERNDRFASRHVEAVRVVTTGRCAQKNGCKATCLCGKH